MARKRGKESEVLATGPALLLDTLDEIDELERRAREIGRDLYLAGMSWADIGRLLGITRQSARARFGARLGEWSDLASVVPLPGLPDDRRMDS